MLIRPFSLNSVPCFFVRVGGPVLYFIVALTSDSSLWEMGQEIQLLCQFAYRTNGVVTCVGIINGPQGQSLLSGVTVTQSSVGSVHL